MAVVVVLALLVVVPCALEALLCLQARIPAAVESFRKR